jgi:uncharacterized protein YbjQ (UPF0145 family)
MSEPSQWTLRHEGKDYPAESFATVREWYRTNHVPHDSQIFDPEQARWLKPGELLSRVVENILVTTTPGFEGHHIRRYIDVESVEVVFGTGPLTELTSGVEDFLGRNSTEFEAKLQGANRCALEQLKYRALCRGGNAVVGLDLDYTEFSSNRVGVIANGTVVELE